MVVHAENRDKYIKSLESAEKGLEKFLKIHQGIFQSEILKNALTKKISKNWQK
jgi:hypothetical protein